MEVKALWAIPTQEKYCAHAFYVNSHSGQSNQALAEK